jgi:hypothetical protein
MRTIQELDVELQGLTRAKLLVFCAWCVEQSRPIIEGLARDEFKTLWRHSVDELWKAAEGGSINPRTLLRTLMQQPEAHADDCLYPEYFVGRGAVVLFCALDAVRSATTAKDTRNAAVGLWGIANDFDFAVNKQFRARILGDQALFKDIQILEQSRILTIPKNSDDISSELIKRLRDGAKASAQTLAKLFVDYCDAHGWKLRIHGSNSG